MDSSASLNLKRASTLNSSLSSYQINVSPKTFRTPITPYQEKYAPPSATKSSYLLDQQNVSSPPVLTLSISLHKNNVRAASVSRSILAFNTISLNSSL